MPDSPKTTAKTTVSLPKEVFGLEVQNHDLLKRAYESYLANGRENFAVTKTRGLVRGGGKKPWRQKGTGRARFGSSRNPIWRGGGVVFGPNGTENYTKTLPVSQKRLALKQALTLASKSKKIIVDDFNSKEGKTKDTLGLVKKHSLNRRALIVVDNKTDLIERSSRNVQNIKVVQAQYLNVFDVLNADKIVISSKSIELVKDWLTRPVKANGGQDV